MNKYVFSALSLIALLAPISNSYASASGLPAQTEIEQLEMQIANAKEYLATAALSEVELQNLNAEIKSTETRLAYAKQQLANTALFQALENNSPEAVTQAFALGADPYGVNPAREHNLYTSALSVQAIPI